MAWDHSRGSSDLVAHRGCMVRGGHCHPPGGSCSLLGSLLLHVASSSVGRLGLLAAIRESGSGACRAPRNRGQRSHITSATLCGPKPFADLPSLIAEEQVHRPACFSSFSQPYHPRDDLPPKSAVFTLNHFLLLLSEICHEPRINTLEVGSLKWAARLQEALEVSVFCFSQFPEVPCSLACGSSLRLPSRQLSVFTPV